VVVKFDVFILSERINFMFKKTCLFILFLFICPRLIYAQTAFKLGGASTDAGNDIAIDKNGNIIVVGQFSNTVDFDPGSAVHNLSSNGNVDNFIAKYNTQGFFQWAVSFGSADVDLVNRVKTDSNSNIYLCGSFSAQTDFDPGAGSVIRSPVGMTDAYVLKLDMNGNFVWVVSFGSDSLDEASDLDIDGSGNIVVTGYFQDTVDIGGEKLIGSDGKNIFLVKFNPDGIYQWQFTWGNSLNAEGLAVKADFSNNYYLSGYKSPGTIEPKSSFKKTFGGSATNKDIFLSEFSTNGTMLWSRTIGGAREDFTSKKGIALFEGNIYITGVFSDTVDFDPSPSGSANLISNGDFDIFVAVYSSAGNFISCFGFGGALQDKPYSIAVDNFGDIFLTGSFKGTADFDPTDQVYYKTSQGTNGASDIFIAKYNLGGNLIWVNTYGAPVSGSSYLSFGSTVELDSVGNFIASGSFFGSCDFDPSSNVLTLSSSGLSDAYMVKYNRDGNIWRNIPNFSPSTYNLNFGHVEAGTTKELAIVVNNYGDGNLEITNVNSNNTYFSVTPTVATILPFKEQQFVIRFSPVELGMQSGRILFSHNASGGKDSIVVSGTGTGLEGTVCLYISPGWNLISLPVIMPNNTPNILFPDAASKVFNYSGNSYTIVDTLNMTEGYWVKFSIPETLCFKGIAVDSAAVNVKSGWNLIGGISYPVPTNSIILEPPDMTRSNFYEYDIAYKVAQTLAPGKGYWVKVSKDGKLILKAF